MLLYTGFLIVVAAVGIAWLAQPEDQDDRTALALVLSAPVGLMWGARGALMLASEDLRHQVARREPLPFARLGATKVGAAAWVVVGCVLLGYSAGGAIRLLG